MNKVKQDTKSAGESRYTVSLPRVGKRTKIIVIAIAVFVGGIVLISELTPRLFVAGFRMLVSTVPDSVTIGPYADDIKTVKTSETVSIPVDGLPDAKITMYSPDTAAGTPRPLILYIHGGGWIVGSAEQYATFAKLLASNGYVVANLDYSLAPEYKYPTPIKQSAAAIDYLQQHAKDYGADPAKFFIGGNSAGAQIAAQLGAIITNPELKQKVGVDITIPPENLKGLLLFNGVYDSDTAGKTGFPNFIMYVWSYTGQKDYANYPRIDELSIVKNVTSHYPATFLTVGDADPLESQTYELDAILRAKGVSTMSLYWTGSNKKLPHDYIYQLNTDGAQTAYKDAVAFINDRSAR